jgi:hypothetical protein
MINLALTIRNPFSQQFTNLWCKSYDTLFKHKFIEIEFYKDSTWLTFMLNWTVRQSHAGLDIELGLFGYVVHFNFYDSRHWNFEQGRYFVYDEEKGLH